MTAISLDLCSLRGLAYMVSAIVAVQGAAYVFQLMIAFLLGPAQFGVVRSLEAVLGLFMVVGSLGMPSLAVRYVAEIEDYGARGRLLTRLLLIAAGSGLLVSSLVYTFASQLADQNAVPYLRRLVWVTLFAACARTALNYYQGCRQIRRYSLISTSIACGVLPLSFVAVTVGGIDGWICARYGTEAVALAATLAPIARLLRAGRLPSTYSPWRLARVGSVLSMSLLVRTSLDNLGTLTLVAVGAPAAQIGYYGIGVIAMLGFLILPACIGSLALPRFVQDLTNPEALRATFSRLVRLCLVVTLPLLVLGMVSLPPLIRLLFPAYIASVPVVETLLVSVPARALTTMSGTLLVALDLGHATLFANLLLLSAGVVLMLLLVPPFGIAAAAWATVGIELVSMFVYGLLAKRGLSNRRRWSEKWSPRGC
jgi:O-antigen/teichoic acid export membrane protein